MAAIESLDVWAAILRRARSCWRPLLTLHLAYTALGIILLAPLPGLLVKLLLRLSGEQLVADQDIAWFLISPFGIASLILVAAILIAIAVLTQASLMFVATGGYKRERPAWDALRFAVRRLIPILALSVQLAGRVGLLVFPFIGAGGVTAWLLLTTHDINFYLSIRPLEFWIAGALIGLILLWMAVVLVRRLLGWSLALPLMLFADLSPRRAFAESERLTRERRPLILAVMAIWALIATLLGGLVIALVEGLGRLIVPHFLDALTPLVLVLGGLVALWGLLSVLSTAFNGATFALALLELAERLRVPIKQSAPSGPLSDPRGAKVPLTARAATIGVIVAALVSLATGVWLVRDIELTEQLVIVAHRGAAGKAPENTLAAVRQAVVDGADWVEIDVQESADGEVVVIHDSDFMKLSGEPLKVWDGTLEEIRAIDVGRWFGAEFAGERVPTLREVLETARGKAKVLIELKYYGHDQRLEERVIEIVEQTGMTADVAIMSLNHQAIDEVRVLRPDWTLGLLTAQAIGDLTRVDADFLAVNMGMATAHFVRRARAAGKPVFVWTPNDVLSISRMMSSGVTGVITDEPALARCVVEARARMSPIDRLLVHTALLFGRPIPAKVYRDTSP